jgi:hypothetical protein
MMATGNPAACETLNQRKRAADQLFYCGVAGNRTRCIKRLELRNNAFDAINAFGVSAGRRMG